MAQSENRDSTIEAVYRKVACTMMQRFVKAVSSPLWEVMVASLLCHTDRTARWFTALGASGIICLTYAPHQGSDPRMPSGRPRWAPIVGRGLCGGTISGR